MACVGSGLPLSDHITLQPTRQLIHTAAPIQGKANNTPNAKLMRRSRITYESVNPRKRGRKNLQLPEAASARFDSEEAALPPPPHDLSPKRVRT